MEKSTKFFLIFTSLLVIGGVVLAIFRNNIWYSMMVYIPVYSLGLWSAIALDEHTQSMLRKDKGDGGQHEQ